MKKILSSILMTAALLIAASCSNSKSNQAAGGACCNNSPVQHAHGETARGYRTQMICGVAFDGAMNSIFLRTAGGDTVSFGYPELPPSKRVSWMIGDTVTISYINTTAGTDSVIHMYKGCITDCR